MAFVPTDEQRAWLKRKSEETGEAYSTIIRALIRQAMSQDNETRPNA